MENNDKPLGAQSATAVESAGNVQESQLSHVARAVELLRIASGVIREHADDASTRRSEAP